MRLGHNHWLTVLQILQKNKHSENAMNFKNSKSFLSKNVPAKNDTELSKYSFGSNKQPQSKVFRYLKFRCCVQIVRVAVGSGLSSNFWTRLESLSESGWTQIQWYAADLVAWLSRCFLHAGERPLSRTRPSHSTNPEVTLDLLHPSLASRVDSSTRKRRNSNNFQTS